MPNNYGVNSSTGGERYTRATLCVYTALVWLPRYSLLLPDDGQVPKRCKNNGTGSDVMCSAMYGNGCVHLNSFHT